MSGYDDSLEDLNPPIVIDNGSGAIKAGIAGRERPKIVIPACIGDPKHKRVILQGARTEKFYGEEAMKYRGLLKLNYPIKQGVIVNENDMLQLWQHVYSSDLLDTKSEDHPVLLTESPLNPLKNRTKTATIFFEQFNVPRLYFAPPPVLALYASGRLTGCVLDSGHGVTSCVPICEGFALPHAITRMDVAGSDVNINFQNLLRESGVTFHTSSELETIRTIKEKVCELLPLGQYKAQYSTSQENKSRGISAGITSSVKIKKDEDANSIKYALPDGSILDIGSARFKSPEILFDPSLIGLEYRGIHYCVLDSIQKADLDLRRDLYQRVVLSGGTTVMKNFGKRLVSELQANVPKARVKVYAPRERHLTAWIGGSLLSFLESFRPMWIQKKEYQENGSSILLRKSFF